MNKITKIYIVTGSVSSKILATLITFNFAYNAIPKLIDKKEVLFSSMSLALLGTLAGITSLTYGFRTILENKEKEECSYASEKLFHGLLLLAQMFLVKAASNSLSDFFSFNRALVLIVQIPLAVINGILLVFVVWFVWWGFDSVNSLLWDRYITRVQKINM